MKKNSVLFSSSLPEKKNLQQKKNRNKIHYYTDTNIDGYVDIAMSQELNKKINIINDQIEDVGKLCDKKKKDSYEEYKELLNYERQQLNQGIKDAINELKQKLKEYHEKANFDYKGKFKEVNTQLNNCINTLDKDITYNSKLQCKYDELEEDNNFYQKQVENMRDMNYYLKLKLKTMKDLEEKNKSEQLDKNIIISTNNNLTTDENSNFNSNILSKINNNEEPLLITTTGNAYKKTKEYLDIKEHIEKDLKFKMNFIIARIKKDILNTKKENEKLKDSFKEMYYKNNNIYMDVLKNCVNDIRNRSNFEDESKDIYYKNNSSDNENYFSGNNSSTAYGSKSITNHGYMDKFMKKEIMLKYLENENVKKFIYKYLYEV